MAWRNTYRGHFLKATDLPKAGKRVKILSVAEEVLRNDEGAKLVAELKGVEQRWVINATNCELLEELFGNDEPDEWADQTVRLFNDRSVRGPNGEKGAFGCGNPAPTTARNAQSKWMRICRIGTRTNQ